MHTNEPYQTQMYSSLDMMQIIMTMEISVLSDKILPLHMFIPSVKYKRFRSSPTSGLGRKTNVSHRLYYEGKSLKQMLPVL